MFPDLEFIKTCLNGLRHRIEQVEKQTKNWVTSFVRTNRSNWAQNDPEALDYVKNRTHWDDESQTQTIDYDAWTGDRPSIPLILGVWYEVSWSSAVTGNVYAQYMNTDEADGRFECKQNSDGELYVGYEGGAPFCIFSDRTEINTSWSQAIRVSGLRLTGEITPGLHRLDKKYIPRDVFNEIHVLGNSVEQQNLALSDLSGAKMDRSNPTGEGAFSLNRKNGSTVGQYSFAAGYRTTASLYASFAAGETTTASGNSSFAIGYNTTASGNSSFAAGYSTIASGGYSFATGRGTTASGNSSFATGWGAIASGNRSFATGENTTASGDYSFAAGWQTVASYLASFVAGKYNVVDTSNKYVHIIGNGSGSTSRSNAYTLDWSGNGWFAGDVFVGGSSQDDGIKLLKTGEAIPIPSTASIGQVLVVKAVDENGKPTEWETVDAVDAMVVSSSTPDSTKKFKITVDDSGTITATEIN